MTINTIDVTSPIYSGNGIATEFAYDFPITDKSELLVYRTNVNGTQSLLTVDSDYTVTGVGDDSGDVVFSVAPVTGESIFIRSNRVATQLTDFDSQGGFFPDVHEDSFDKLTILNQQLTDRALLFPLGASRDAALNVLPSPAANQALVWDIDGSLINSTINNLVTDIDLNSTVDRYDSIASLISSSPTSSSVLLTSYYGGWAASVSGPKGSHKRHRTGGDNTSPTVGSPVAVSTVGTGDQAGYCWDALGQEWFISELDDVWVTWLGARGDGVTDDTTAIQDAMNIARVVTKTDISGKVVFVAGSVFFPPGIYNHQELTVDVGIKMHGQSMTTAQLVFTNPTSSTGAITFTNTTDEIFGVLVENLSMDGGVTTGDGITVNKGIRICGINNCYIHSFNKNVTASSCFTFEINRSYIRTSGTINVELLTCTGGVINSSRVDNAGTDGIYLTGGSFSVTNCQVQSSFNHGIHGVDAENVSVFNTFFEANDKNITGLYNDIHLEDGGLASCRYLNVTGGYFTPGPGVTAGQKAGPVYVQTANIVSLDFDIKGNGFAVGFTGGPGVRRAVLCGEFASVGARYSVDAATNLMDMTATSNNVNTIVSNGVNSASYDQTDWQLQVGRKGNSFVGIGTHDNGRPSLQGFGTGSSGKLLLNPQGGNVGIGSSAVNPDQKLVVDGVIKTLGAWNVNGHQIGGIVLFANGNDLRLSIGQPTSAIDGILIGTAT